MITPDDVKIYLKIEDVWTDISAYVTQWSRKDGEYCLTGRVSIESVDLFEYCDPTQDFGVLRLRFEIGSEVTDFFIEEQQTTVGRAKFSFEIWGRSSHAYLSDSYARTLNDSDKTRPYVDDEITSSTECESANGIWSAGKCSFENSTPEACVSAGGYWSDGACLAPSSGMTEAVCLASQGVWDAETSICYLPITDSTLCTQYEGDWLAEKCTLAETIPHIWQTRDVYASEVLGIVLLYTDFDKTIHWDIEDYFIKRGSFSVSNMSPIEVIKRLAETLGADVIGEANGDIRVQAYLVEADSPSSMASYDEYDDIVALSARIEKTSGYNSVVVNGQTLDVGNAYLSASRIDSDPLSVGVPFVIRVHYYHPSLLPVFWQLESTYVQDEGGAYVPAIEHDRTVKQIDRIEDELVILDYGVGRLSRPRSTDGSTVVESDYTERLFDSKTVSYSCYYVDFTLTINATGTYKVAFYFTDKSAKQIMEFEIQEPAYTPLTIVGYDDCTSILLPQGTYVELDGVLKGTLDADGSLFINENFLVGSTHTIRLYDGTGQLDFYQDFTVQEDAS